MVFARNVLGARAAIVTGALLALDPSFLFISRHDWGSFALGFLCRCAGLAFLASGWPRRSVGLSFAGGLCFGLGIYNKIDFAVCVGALGLALVAVRPRTLSEAFEAGGRRTLSALLGLLLGAAPMIASAGSVFTTAARVARRQAHGAGDWSEKLHTFASTARWLLLSRADARRGQLRADVRGAGGEGPLSRGLRRLRTRTRDRALARPASRPPGGGPGLRVGRHLRGRPVPLPHSARRADPPRAQPLPLPAAARRRGPAAALLGACGPGAWPGCCAAEPH